MTWTRTLPRRPIRVGVALVATLAATIVGGATPSSAAPTVTVQVGDVPGAQYISPAMVLPDGTTAGGISFEDGRQRGFRWTPVSGMQVLQPLPGDVGSAVSTMGPDGTVYGTSYATPAAPDEPQTARLIRWRAADGWQPTLIGRPALDVNHNMYVTRVNAAGTALIYGERELSQNPLSTQPHGYVWSEADGFRDLGDFGSYVMPVAMNDAGTVTGTAFEPSTQKLVTFVWTPTDGLTSIGTLPGDDESSPTGIDRTGRIVGTSTRYLTPGTDPLTTVYAWSATTGMTALLGPYSRAVDLNPDGTLLSLERVTVTNPGAPTENTQTLRPLITRVDGTRVRLPELPDRPYYQPIFAQSIDDLQEHVVVGDVNEIDQAWLWSAADGYVALPRSNPSSPRQGAYYAAGDLVIGMEYEADFAGSHLIAWRLQPAPPNPDADGDGVDDAIDTGASTFVDSSLTQPTSGRVVDVPAGLMVRVSDEPSPDGVRVSVGGSAGATDRVTLSVCGFTVRLAPGSEAVITCGSITAAVRSGTLLIDLGGGTTVAVTSGATARVSDAAGGGYTVQNLASSGNGSVTITTDGLQATVPVGSSTPLRTWTFLGFLDPVKNAPTVNTARGGQAIALKWRLTDAAGRPVTTLTAASMVYATKNCASGAVVSTVPQNTTGASGLQNLGNGNYQINWKTPSVTGCGELRLDIGQGVLHVAQFQLR